MNQKKTEDIDNICDTPGCDGLLDNSEGYDGYCGYCADKLEAIGYWL